MRPRRDRDLAVDLPDLLGAAAVRPPLVDRDLLADEILVDRLGGLLDVALGQAVLDLRGVAVRRGRADRERQLDAVDDPLEEEVALGRLQLLRVLLGVGESSQVVLELLAHRPFDGHEALLLEQHREARAGLQLPLDVRLGRVHRRRAGDLGQELVGDGSALAKAVLLDPLPDRVPVGRLDLGGEVGIEPLRLAGLRAQILLRVTELADLGVRELERLEQELVGNLVGAGLDHRQAVLRADDDQVERRDLVVLLVGRVEDPLVVDPPDAHRSDRAEERQRREHQGRRGPVDAEDVVRDHHVRGEDGADHLNLVAEALRPERPDRAVDHARGQRGALGRAPFPLEEAAGDLAGRVGPLLDVDRQREEVGALAGLRPSHRGGEHHRLARPDDDGAVCLLGELAGLEDHLLAADLDGDRGHAAR